MSTWRVIYAIAHVDVLERVRRYSFLVTLLFAVCLGFAAATGRVSLRFGDSRGPYSSAWIGAMVALVAALFISLVGFYIVKNAIGLDRQTRVGQIMAATPLSNSAYLLGKFLSNVVVLVSMVAVLALCALAMQFLAAEDGSFRPWPLLSPFVLLALPAMFVTASLAVLFETIPGLRGGFGNVLWFFVWGVALALSQISDNPLFDVFGLGIVIDSMIPLAHATIPGYQGGFALTIVDKPMLVCPDFRWEGIEWTLSSTLSRAAWIVVAIVLALAGVLFFDRFDPSRVRRRAFESSENSESEHPALPASKTSITVRLEPLPPNARRFGTASLIAAELRLALKGYRWWWFMIGLALLAGQCFAPFEVARGPLLALAWIWPVFVCSALGTREEQFGTQQILISCPRILPRQMLAAWMSAVLVIAMLGAGAAARLLIAGQFEGLIAWAAGALFIPSLALALGVWSGSSKFFEALYTVIWYIGPLNRTPGLDFTGAADGPAAGPFALMYLALSVILVTAAFTARARQIRKA